jgi:hypothetical protein
MSLFRQQALEQRRLPDPIFTPVTIVAIRRWLWIGAALSFVAMAGVWLVFGTLYTTYETSLTMTGTTTVLTPRSQLEVSTDPLRPTHFVAVCPEIFHGIVRSQDTQSYTLLLEEPVYAACRVTLILRQERPLERLLR